MSIESELYTVLSAVCPRTFPDFAPTTTARPYVTYQQIGGEAINFVDRLVPSKRNARMQVNVWADTRASAVTTMQAIEDAIRMSVLFQGEPESAMASDFDADFPVYSSSQDFTIWSSR
jgi:hypothetical protein